MSQIFMQFLSALCAFTTILVLTRAQDQSDFISIDCGLQQNLDYTQSTTTIRYTPDADYVTTGEVRAISRANNPAQQFWFIRVFPEGTRNCYKINIRSGQRYLIRASFMYGNYDGENNVPEFELHLGANLWDSVVFTPQSGAIIKEIIHVPVRDYMHVCLVNVGKGVPFISAIEIRRLRLDAYQTEVGSSLALLKRINLAINETVYRYPSDENDRIWTHEFADGWDEVIADPTTLLKADQSGFELPSDVMSTAVKSSSFDNYLNITWAPKAGFVDKNSSYYIYMHFAEVEVLSSPRDLTAIINGETIDKTFYPVYLTMTTKNSSVAAGSGGYNLSVYSSEWSERPFLNAYEIYMEKSMMASETNQQDVEAITNIKSTYNIVKNWQGDPCNPKAYLWEGVNCSYYENNSSRIISLDLSSSGLTGDIADSIANLTMIQILDLSDNKLSGQIPEYLSKLSKLNLINLDQNELTGSVPAGLIAKTNEGLSLSLCGNPSLIGNVSCQKKKKKFLIPIVASIIVTLLVSSTAAAIMWNSKRCRRFLVYLKLREESAVSDSVIARSRKGYDVFLSFRGEDTREGFARNLYEALKKEEIKTFFDDKNLKKGDQIAETLLKAIGASDISIILFSKQYVTSAWCLDELEKIVDCMNSNNQLVIPVFYKVDPSDIRHQAKSFSLQKWIDKKNVKVPIWQNALRKVASISGVHYTNGYECKTIEKIVKSTLVAMEEKKEKSMERFVQKFPPNGEDEIVIYLTTKTKDKNFKNCESVLKSLSEFDLKHMHLQKRDVTIRNFEHELKKLLNKTVAPPRLFVKGKYVGGYDEVSRLMKEPWFRDALNKYCAENPAIDEVSLHGQGVAVEAAGAAATVASETENVGAVNVRVYDDFDGSTDVQTSKGNAGIRRSVTMF